MRYLVILLSVVFLASCGGSGTSNVEMTADEKLKTVEIAVVGMTCTGCENTVQKHVGALKGVKEVKASFEQENTIIEFDGTILAIEEIERVILDAGYEVHGNKMVE